MYKLLFSFSLLLNLALFLWLSSSTKQSDAATAAPSASPPQWLENTLLEGKSIKTWSDLDNADTDKLARELKAIGCPERLITNLLMAEIDREFSARQQKMRRLAEFWIDHDTRKTLSAERQLDLYELANERRRAIHDRLGISWRDAPDKEWEGMKWHSVKALFYGHLSPDGAESADALHQSLEVLKDDLNLITDAIGPEQADEFREGVYTEYLEDSAVLLTPEQRRHIDMAWFDMELMDVNRPDKKFLQELEGQDHIDMILILMPDDYSRTYIGLQATQNKERRPGIEKEILERFGPEMAEHFRNFKW